MINFCKNKNKGFTLIELLITLTVFSIILISVSSISLSVIKGQRKAFALQTVQESSRYMLESIIKEIRMSKINTDTGTHNLLNIVNSDGKNIRYQFFGNKLRRSINGGTWDYLSPTDVNLTGSFYVKKNPNPNNVLVTISMQVKNKNTKVEEKAEMYIQNSITSRDN